VHFRGAGLAAGQHRRMATIAILNGGTDGGVMRREAIGWI